MPSVEEMIAAFNQENDKKSWTARVYAGAIHFSSRTGMVTIIYDSVEDRFAVKFNKFHGAWGDYINAISRSLFTILNTLKAGGIAIEAPQTLDGCVIECTTGAEGVVYVRWQGLNAPPAVVNPINPYPLCPMCSMDETGVCPAHRAGPSTLPPIL